MDLVEAGSQGLGLALAAGALLAAPGARGMAGTLLAIVATAAGAALFGASLATEDHPAWPGWLAGATAALLSYVALRDLAAAARRRAGAGGIALFVSLYAIALAGLALLGPLALVAPVALVATAWLFVSRRRRSSEKHAGLRSLR